MRVHGFNKIYGKTLWSWLIIQSDACLNPKNEAISTIWRLALPAYQVFRPGPSDGCGCQQSCAEVRGDHVNTMSVGPLPLDQDNMSLVLVAELDAKDSLAGFPAAGEGVDHLHSCDMRLQKASRFLESRGCHAKKTPSAGKQSLIKCICMWHARSKCVCLRRRLKDLQLLFVAFLAINVSTRATGEQHRSVEDIVFCLMSLASRWCCHPGCSLCTALCETVGARAQTSRMSRLLQVLLRRLPIVVMEKQMD